MELRERAAYADWGLSEPDVEKLGIFGDLLLAARSNVTAIRDPHEIELSHFLDSLSLLDVAEIRGASQIVDVGSGGGLPAVVLALALPASRVTAIDSVAKKCAFIEEARTRLGLENLRVVCGRAEDVGRTEAREAFDVATARAVASLAVLAELTVPLIRTGGVFVASKAALSDQERMEGEAALAILGCDRYDLRRARSFAQAENRWLFLAYKDRSTPAQYPRRTGVPAKRPLRAQR
ncbi:MAG TPA: 16S rRNA (guanine(527)-N(7))-methyltransferase RsmG [Thermoleophilia bacterium]|nr:16S rRNA (guanine(527)-N(7))-methyltransferase RsmG [Thermoleophilia bacterium]